MTKSGDALIAHSKSRTEAVESKIRRAMHTIERELENHNGVYPLNGGRLSLAEVCRRAGVHKITLQGASHKSTTKPMLEKWIASVASTLITGRTVVRKTVTARADDWKAKYIEVARQMNEVYAIEVVARDQKLKAAQERIAELEAELSALRSAMSKVSLIRTSKKSK